MRYARSARWGASLLLAAMVAMTAGCGEEPVVEPEVRPVRTHRVSAGGGEVTRSLAGVARAGVESRLSFRVGGPIQSVHVSLGDRVARGQVLARLDPIDYELRVEAAQASLAQARATLRRAEADYERVRALYENNNASKSELDAARAAAESGQAQVAAVAKQLEQARQQVAYTVLRAPADGAIAAVEVEVNENVRGGQEIFLLTAGASPEVEVAVPEVLIGQVEVGQPVEVIFDALPERRFPARVTEVGVAVTGAATTFKVTAKLEASDPAIRSGMAAEAVFRFRQAEAGSRMVVPGVAVGEDRQGRFVFVVEEGSGEVATVRRRAIEIGPIAEGLAGIVVESGLEEGELVVTAGVRRLSDGMTVKILDEGGSGG